MYNDAANASFFEEYLLQTFFKTSSLLRRLASLKMVLSSRMKQEDILSPSTHRQSTQFTSKNACGTAIFNFQL